MASLEGRNARRSQVRILSRVWLLWTLCPLYRYRCLLLDTYCVPFELLLSLLPCRAQLSLVWECGLICFALCFVPTVRTRSAAGRAEPLARPGRGRSRLGAAEPPARDRGRAASRTGAMGVVHVASACSVAVLAAGRYPPPRFGFVWRSVCAARSPAKLLGVKPLCRSLLKSWRCL